MCLRGRSHREGKDLAMPMSVNLRWRIASPSHHVEWGEAMITQCEACERIILCTQTDLDKTPGITRTVALHDPA